MSDEIVDVAMEGVFHGSVPEEHLKAQNWDSPLKKSHRFGRSLE